MVKPYIFKFKDAEWASMIIANSVKQAKKLGYEYWCGEQDYGYTDIRVKRVKAKVDISGLPIGVIDELHLGVNELLKRNIMYHSEDDESELSQDDEDCLLYRS